jgi:glutamate racemase
MEERIQSKNLGVFDSGIGGLTVVKEIIKILPNENIIYFGDTARVPYGNKSEKVILDYSMQIANFLISKDIKMIIVACNTAASVALEYLERKYDLPIIGVIKPGAKAAVELAQRKKIGVIGTYATIRSTAYTKEINKLDPSVTVISQPCPLFVPLVEEGWLDHKVTRLVAKEYLDPLINNDIDTLVLGCTHYPLLKNVIQDIVGPKIKLIDSAESTAKEILRVLNLYELRNISNKKPNYQFYVSDLPHKFDEIGERFLGQKLIRLDKIEL